ncbi:WD repeat-containing protein 18 [Bicyclus anynana]|uniref:WD repeat-containing protein 18 n=1 Tax=Bicyclus anynana TaxID=110368 RepID=A0A6J1NNX4_BICAN|nr:WD repeat-containing protein 18 [Bicyclus anynana]
MSNLLEVLVTCDANNTLWTSCVWDPHNGTNLMTYKGGGTAENRTACFIGSDYFAAVERTKPILHIWPLNSQQTVQGMRFILPGKASAFAVTPDGSYCIAGIDEKIYLWQIASGNLLTIINRHYQKVNHLKFTSDGSFFVSTAEDGMVMVWSLVTVAANPEVGLISQTTAGQHDPVYIFSDHFLPVTDMCISKNGMHGRLFTVSSDRTCKIYDLTSGEVLLNLVFDEPLSAICLDILELNVFVGSVEGKIFQFSLTNAPRSRDMLMNNDNNSVVLSAHTKAVTCLSASLNGELLVSGGNDDQVILWHIRSRQPIRIIRHKGSITNAFFSLNYKAIYQQDFTPNIILHSLERTLENNSDDVVEIDVLVNKKNNFWSQYENNDANVAISEDSDTTKALQDEIEKMKQINANLYTIAIQKALETVPISNKANESNRKKKKHKKQ